MLQGKKSEPIVLFRISIHRLILKKISVFVFKMINYRLVFLIELKYIWNKVRLSEYFFNSVSPF